MTILLALMAFFGWGISDSISPIVVRRISPLSATFWNLLLRTCFYLIISPFFVSNLHRATINALIISLITGFSSALGYLFYMKSAKLIHPSITAGVSSSWAGLSVIWSVAFLNENLSFQQAFIIMVIFLGLVFISIDFHRINRRLLHNRGILYALITLFFWSICGAFIKIPVQQVGWFWPSFLLSLPFSLGLLLLKGRMLLGQPPSLRNRTLLPIIASVALTLIAEIGYNLGVGSASVTLVAPIGGSYPILSVLLCYLIFKDPIAKLQKLGIAITLSGMITLYFLPSFT